MVLMMSPGRRWVWYGGRPSLDFVNTRRNRGAGRRDAAAGGGMAGDLVAGDLVAGDLVAGDLAAGDRAAGDHAAGDAAAEYLRGPADLAAWLSEAGLIAPPAAGGRCPVDEDTLAGALGLREAIDAAVTATVAAVSVPGRAVRCVNEWIAAEPRRPALRLEAGMPVLRPPREARTPRGALALIAADAAELLGTELRERLRICPGPGCRGRFLDDSPAGRRRWCSMAVCGNRSKAAAHRQGVHAAAVRP
jgi:predicted RNA-binding Zn ribbon-like protein